MAQTFYNFQSLLSTELGVVNMATTYTPIATTTISGSSTNSVTFNSFSGYTDLVLVSNWASANSTAFLNMQFNGDTGNNYSQVEMRGDGSAATAYRNNNADRIWINLDVGSATTLGKTMSICNIMNYASTDMYKTVLSRAGAFGANYYGVSLEVDLWRSTSAITSFVLYNRASGTNYNFVDGSTFTLYGILAA